MDEVARLEGLLAARTRERRDLDAELARRTALLRDAMARFADLPATTQERTQAPADAGVEAMVHFAAQRDAAVARALDAEASRAEAMFRLDEALGHLRVAQGKGQQEAELEGKVRGLRLRLSEIEEDRDIAAARLMLAEQDLLDAREEVTAEKRKREDLREQFEIVLVQARSAESAQEQRLEHVEVALSAARGMSQGLLARANESELALLGMRARALRAEHGMRDALDKLVAARTEAAENKVESHAAAQRTRELQQELATAEQAGHEHHNEALRLRAEVGALREQCERLVREGVAHHQGLQGTLRATRQAAVELGAAVSEVLGGTRTSMGAVGTVGAQAPEVSEELTTPGTALGFEATDALEQKLRASEERVQELEAMIAGRMSREPGMSTLKGELIDVRASAARLSDDLAKERTRRRKIGVTVRALQAASESGEDIAPWVEEVLAVLAEGASIPPPR